MHCFFQKNINSTVSTGQYTLAAANRRLGVRKTPVGLTPFVVFYLTHIASPRNVTHCSMGGWQRRKPRTLSEINIGKMG